ncbi:hypothetical protein F503_01171 [Ophiostoma piceae UAMH 11346]|uniref:Uncharacterized protein n=1 Tax=Ophiostoma piceae (strain UAMH 11346) TaxID=1262450 RepID=S3CPA6_OPHP1|nr:hypothetical protein F503_01171 [Ophiostoma piceae UAMH 11346]
MTTPSKALIVAIGLLAADATIEMGFVTSMVSWLHSGAPSGSYTVNTPSSISSAPPTYKISGLALNMLVDQGHTSNGAAGTALVLIGIVGSLALLARTRFPSSKLGRLLYYIWMGIQIPALFLTIGALGYVFAVTNKHKGQTINQAAAISMTGPYDLDQWTPQNWFHAVRQLDLNSSSLRSDINFHYRIMLGWQYNLIPLFLLQLVETAFAFRDFFAWRKRGTTVNGHVEASYKEPVSEPQFYPQQQPQPVYQPQQA